MKGVRVGNVRIGWRGDGAVAALPAELFARFEPHAGEVDVALELDGPPLPPLPEGAVPSFHQGELRAHVCGTTLRLDDGEGALAVSDDGRRVYGALQQGAREAAFVVERTLFAAVLVALRHHGLFHMHAAALVDPAGNSGLVVGSGGSGKSTTTLALLAAGASYLSDDAILLAAGTAAPKPVVGFPKAFHVGARTLGAFPALLPFVGPPYRAFSDKRAFAPEQVYPGRLHRDAALPRATLFPRVTDHAVTTIVPLTAADAHYHLVESSAFCLAAGMARREEHLALLGVVASAARAYEVALGADVLEAPAAVGAKLLRLLASR